MKLERAHRTTCGEAEIILHIASYFCGTLWYLVKNLKLYSAKCSQKVTNNDCVVL